MPLGIGNQMWSGEEAREPSLSEQGICMVVLSVEGSETQPLQGRPADPTTGAILIA